MAERTWEAIGAIAADIERRVGADAGSPRHASLGGGSAGLALFYAYLAEARGDETCADQAMAHVDRSIDALRSLRLPPQLYGGFTGVGWMVEHLEGRLFESEEETQESEIDGVLIEMLDGRPWQSHYDLISGLAGFAVYALEALPRPTARRCLELLSAKVEELAVALGGGRTWFTPPALLPESQRRSWPAGSYNLGVAHGAPGVIAALARIAAAGIEEQRIGPLVDDAVRWLLAQELPAETGSCFASWVAEDHEPTRTRLAWCYGDAGVAASLLLTARAMGREDWEREARRIARVAAARPLAGSGVMDAGICHGAAGLGHVFNRLYQATGDEELGKAARFWFEHALGLLRPGEGVGGYLSAVPDEAGHFEWEEDVGFLTGASGVALGLLGAVSDVEPEWDRVLLTSVAPRGSG